ncbi:UNVERIFIED_CONTAM: hypothetical protein Sradi_2302100 [Sesamum radiatum]|uniref:RNase H type-1 domain-containing protein n=1 Tax=Sesamum radiatum TaxID=300843 RepID=A0AAW2T5X7_SESRA
MKSHQPNREIRRLISKRNWLKPGKGWIKVNFDGAISNKKKGGSVGVIARDYNRRWVGWDMTFFPGICDPLHVEAEATRTAAELVTKRSWHRVIIEGDCFTRATLLVSRALLLVNLLDLDRQEFIYGAK